MVPHQFMCPLSYTPPPALSLSLSLSIYAPPLVSSTMSLLQRRMQVLETASKLSARPPLCSVYPNQRKNRRKEKQEKKRDKRKRKKGNREARVLLDRKKTTSDNKRDKKPKETTPTQQALVLSGHSRKSLSLCPGERLLSGGAFCRSPVSTCVFWKSLGARGSAWPSQRRALRFQRMSRQ